jgi:hypothetical protein
MNYHLKSEPHINDYLMFDCKRLGSSVTDKNVHFTLLWNSILKSS